MMKVYTMKFLNMQHADTPYIREAADLKSLQITNCFNCTSRPCHGRLLTVAARGWLQCNSCGICGEQSDTEAGFLRVLRSPLPILIPPTTQHSTSSSRAGTMGQLVFDVTCGLDLTPPQEVQRTMHLFVFTRHEGTIKVTTALFQMLTYPNSIMNISSHSKVYNHCNCKSFVN
jgi:hypothetical protein